jgi:alkanesulfonate monooxygenase SsuD/methylene tetrahydromethanopterin reductase-like flavin-dependent oxidoreductase (luciferase family)
LHLAVRMAQGSYMELGIVTTLPSTLAAVRLGKIADSLGFDRFGVSDTAPLLYHSCYPAVTALLLETERIRVGPYVTNPVSRHWSVHGATARAFEELAPGRFFLGIAAGDGAVHSVGLRPATLEEFRDHAIKLRDMIPRDTPIHMAFSGPKGVALAGALASELTIGTGLDPTALRELAGRARAARQSADIAAPLRVWVPAPIYFAKSSTDIPVRRLAASMANLAARFAFASSFECKNVPEAYQPIIRRGLERYEFSHHAKDGANPNTILFDEWPEVRDYLINRFTIIGTPEQCRERLETIVREGDLDGVWLMPTSPSARDGDARHSLKIAAETFSPLKKLAPSAPS